MMMSEGWKLVRGEAQISLACVDCHAVIDANSKKCTGCQRQYGEIGDRPVFLDEAERALTQSDQAEDAENAFKNFFKRWPVFYRFLIHVTVPVLFYGLSARQFLKEKSDARAILNVGSGQSAPDARAVNMDIFAFPNVHVLAGASRMPFPDGTFDVVFSEQVHEHLRKPWEVAQEMVRVTKSGGFIYIATPYMFPLHPSPKDYSRWSIEGLHDLFEGCDLVRSGVRNGPVSGMLIVTASTLALVTSFGIPALRKIMMYVWMLLLTPFKVLDFLFSHFPGAEESAASVYVVMKKRSLTAG